ncbi:MAG: MMPL family transporter, partial [Vicingaceae bacterium]
MAYRVQFVSMSYQLAQMLPKSDNTHIEYESFKSTFGKDGSIVVIGINNENLFELSNFNAWYDLTHKIKNIRVDFKINKKDTIMSGVKEALSAANIYTLVKNKKEKIFDFEQIVKQKPQTQSELDSIKNVIYSQLFYSGYLFTDSTNTSVMAITLNTTILDSKYRNELFEKIDLEVLAFEEKTGIKVHKSGLPYIRANSTTKVKDEILIFLALSVFITSLILYLFFRSFKAMIYSMLVVIIGVVWSVGIQSLFGYKVTILTGLIPPLIIVIGIPNCIFLLNKY